MLRQAVAPAREPMTADDFLLRQQLRLMDGEEEENALIDALAATARAMVESHCRLRLIEQTLTLTVPRFDPAGIAVPVAPVQSVSAVRHETAGGALVAMDPGSFRLLESGPVAVVSPPLGSCWPSSAGVVEVDFVAGFGTDPAAIPPEILQAMRLIVAHLFKNREAVTDTAAAELPLGVRVMLAPWRMYT